MEERTLNELIQQTYDWLLNNNYSQGTLNSFRSVTNQLKVYAGKKDESYFSMDLAIEFLEEHYGLTDSINLRKRAGLRYMEISHGGKGQGPRLHDLRHTYAVHVLQKWISEVRYPLFRNNGFLPPDWRYPFLRNSGTPAQEYSCPFSPTICTYPP